MTGPDYPFQVDHGTLWKHSLDGVGLLAIDHGRLFGMDVNDNLRGWDDDMIAGTVHPVELFELR
ncbi:hypothetical protein [Pseudonocardia sp. DLS-67]